MSSILCLQILDTLRDHRGAPRLRGPPGLVGLDQDAEGRLDGVRRVPAVRHEEEAGGALQGTRRLPPRDTLDRDHGVGLPWKVEDDGEEAGRRMRERHRGVLHLGIMV